MQLSRTTISYGIICTLPIIVFYTLVLGFSVNIPQQDDFDAILPYLLNLSSTGDSGLFDLHVSHRPVLTRLLAELSLTVSNGLELRLLIYVSALCLLGVVYLIGRSLQPGRQRPLAMAVLCLAVFSLFHWSNMTWATAAVQNYVLLLAAVSCISWFNRASPCYFLPAIVLGFLAPYINSSGLLLLPILFLWSFADGRFSSSRHLRLTLTGVTVLLSFYLFFVLLGAQDAGSLFAQSSENLTAASVASLLKAFLIACAGFLHFEPLALAGGLALNLYFLLLLRLRYFEKNAPLFYIYLFLLSSLFLVALFRHESGIRYLIASRYQIYTLLLSALAAISIIELNLARFLPFRYVNRAVLLLFTALYLSSLYYVGNLRSEKLRIESGMAAWLQGDGTALYHPVPARADRILQEALQAGVYAR